MSVIQMLRHFSMAQRPPQRVFSVSLRLPRLPISRSLAHPLQRQWSHSPSLAWYYSHWGSGSSQSSRRWAAYRQSEMDTSIHTIHISACPICSGPDTQIPKALWKCHCGADNLKLLEHRLGNEYTCADCATVFRSLNPDYLCLGCRP